MELTKSFKFEASHVLPKHPGKCSRLHGHSWVLHVSVAGPINRETGFVQDFAEISEVVKPLIERLDHRHLGQWRNISGNPQTDEWGVHGLPTNFYPSSENLLVWIALQLNDQLPQWSTLALEETCTSRATLTRKEYDGLAESH
jgi:6-pyruvoyltetrahydropterin/6-carboxytetrahydropterin synthase